MADGLLEEKRKLQSQPYIPVDDARKPLVGAIKPIAGNSFAVKARPVETTAIPPFEKRRKAVA